MARTKSSVTKKEDQKKARKRSHDSPQDSSESEDEMFTKTEKEESGIPQFIKGTTWPVDTSVEVVVNYDAVKEIRKVKKEFWPLLFHMTRSDPRQISNCICRSKVLMSFVKARMEQNEKTKDRQRRNLISDSEMKNLGLGTNTEHTLSPKRLRKTVSSAYLASSITDLTDAKTEVLKLLTRVSLKRQDFAKLLVWIQKLKLCGKEGAGRWGEVYVKDTTADSSSPETADSDSDEEDKKSSKSRGRGQGKRGNYQGGVRGGRGRGRGQVKNWKVALRHTHIKTKDKTPELDVKKSENKSPHVSSVSSECSKPSKLQTFELKGKTLCKKDVYKMETVDKKMEAIPKCTIPLVDVISVLDKRVMDKKKHESESCPAKRRHRKHHQLGKEGFKDKHINKSEDDQFIPNKKYRLSGGTSCTTSTDPDVPVPVCLYRAEENENMSAPFVEIDNVENGVCVPYEDRFVAKEQEVTKEKEVEQRAQSAQKLLQKVGQFLDSKKKSGPLQTMGSSPVTNPSSSQSSKVKHLTPISQYAARLMKVGIVPNVSAIVEKQYQPPPYPGISVPPPLVGSSTSTYNSITSTILSNKPSTSLPYELILSAQESTVEPATSNAQSVCPPPPHQVTVKPTTSVQNSLKIKEEGKSSSSISNDLLNYSDGVTMNFSQRSEDTNIRHHEPSSSTNGNEDIKTEQIIDFVIIKNEENECISVEDSDDEVSNNAKEGTSFAVENSNVDDQKEADPIIVIDD